MSSPRLMKSKILKLLKEDEEFRYAVAGFIGLADMLKRFEEHDRKFNEIIAEVRDLRKNVSEIMAYIERTSLTIEEEAREIISHRLRERGLELSISNLVLPDMELNLYGADDEVCIIGEVSTRAGARIIEEVDEKIAELSRKHPQYLRRKTIKAVYTMQATPEAIEAAQNRGIWLLKATGDLAPPPI